MWLLAALGCTPSTLTAGLFELELDRDAGTLSVTGPGGAHLDDVRFLSGDGDATVEMSFGAFRFTDETRDLVRAGGLLKHSGHRDPPYAIPVIDGSGDLLGDLYVAAIDDALLIDWVPADAHTRVGLSAACDADDHFLGMGGHAMDVDHVGEAFPLWVSEPGIGKTDDDELPDDWFLTGTRHATSFPVPFVVRPHHPDGLFLDTYGRVDVDLCAADPDRFELVAWDDEALNLVYLAGGTPTATVERLSDFTGRPELPPVWVFGVWGDAIRGPERVREVADTLRTEGVPASLLWTEDWKGGTDTATGYRLGEEWFVDRTLYPDVEALADELEASGFKWLAYFAPFIEQGDVTWDDALAADVLIRDADGEPYVFPGAALKPVSMVDLSTYLGRDWVAGKLSDALDLGFDGWMTDFAEWLPTDAVMANGMTGLQAHNHYPEWWQETHRDAQRGHDATFFVRSGWARTAGLVPVVWAGDQRTSFDADDGFPTVVAMGVGFGASGVPVFTHDVAGYQSVGNPPSDKELWFRWASLGAFSPILRLHHGSYDIDNWQFDSDAETLAHFTKVAREHVRLLPYRYGLAARAATRGTPMIQPVAFVHGGDDWGRTDAWMLGDALLVAPVLERGATSRDVALPGGVDWWDWATLQPAASGTFAADVGQIPVFAASGTTVPTLATIPDTLQDVDGLVDLDDVDDARVVYLFGGGGPFEEADGTTYDPSGRPSGSGEVTETLRQGTVSVAGVTVTVDGPRERTYTFVVP